MLLQRLRRSVASPGVSKRLYEGKEWFHRRSTERRGDGFVDSAFLSTKRGQKSPEFNDSSGCLHVLSCDGPQNRQTDNIGEQGDIFTYKNQFT